VENCVQPEFRWTWQVKEKYQLTSFLKVYGGFTPDHDATQVSIKIKSPVPMVVAMLPSDVANQLHASRRCSSPRWRRILASSAASSLWSSQCTFSLADGPQSLIVAPESTERVPHKKAEIEMQFVKCVENCEFLQTNGKELRLLIR